MQEELFDKLLQLQFSQSPQDIAEWMLRNGLASTLQAYGSSASELRAVAQLPATQISRYTAKLREAIRAAPGHAAFYSSLKRAAALDTGSLLFVHAGLDPYRPLAAQTDAFWWGNTAFMQMNQPYQGFERVVTGCTPSIEACLKRLTTRSSMQALALGRSCYSASLVRAVICCRSLKPSAETCGAKQRVILANSKAGRLAQR